MEVRKVARMSARCCDHKVAFDGLSAAYQRALWAVIAINGTMFLAEMVAGIFAESQALKADALDPYTFLRQDILDFRKNLPTTTAKQSSKKELKPTSSKPITDYFQSHS